MNSEADTITAQDQLVFCGLPLRDVLFRAAQQLVEQGDQEAFDLCINLYRSADHLEALILLGLTD